MLIDVCLFLHTQKIKHGFIINKGKKINNKKNLCTSTRLDKSKSFAQRSCYKLYTQ